MDDNGLRILSQYEYIRDISSEHGVSLVVSKLTGEYCVRKVTAVYNREVYEYIRCNPVLGVPVVKELIEDGDKLIIIEEYIEGETLSECLNIRGVVSEEETLSIIIRLLDILVSFHQNYPPIVHRDIKPSNVILGNNGSVWLIDFNAAKFVDSGKTQDTELIGTKGYAAPEQYGFGSSTERTDVYAVGMLMKEMLYGDSTRPANISLSLSNVINRCTMLEPSDRYEDAYSLRKALHAVKYGLENKGKEPLTDNTVNTNASSINSRSVSEPSRGKRESKKTNIIFGTVIGMILIASIVGAAASVIKLYKPYFKEMTKSGFDFSNKPYGTLVEEDGSIVDMNGTVYTYMADGWNLYTANMISDSAVKISRWKKGSSSDVEIERNKDLGVYDFDNQDSGITWIDEGKNAFSIEIEEPKYTYYDTTEEQDTYVRRAVFTINKVSGGKLITTSCRTNSEYYRFKADSYYVYRAIPLENGLIKIEKWKEADYLSGNEYYYDLTTVNPEGDELDFEWIDDDESSFTIKTHDPEEKEWSEDKKVLFERKK